MDLAELQLSHELRAESLSPLHHSPAFEEGNIEDGGVGVDKLQQEGLKNQSLLEALVSLGHLCKVQQGHILRSYPPAASALGETAVACRRRGQVYVTAFGKGEGSC